MCMDKHVRGQRASGRHGVVGRAGCRSAGRADFHPEWPGHKTESGAKRKVEKWQKQGQPNGRHGSGAAGGKTLPHSASVKGDRVPAHTPADAAGTTRLDSAHVGHSGIARHRASQPVRSPAPIDRGLGGLGPRDEHSGSQHQDAGRGRNQAHLTRSLRAAKPALLDPTPVSFCLQAVAASTRLLRSLLRKMPDA